MSQARGPYKSQLFSTLNRQSQRLRDRLGMTVRHLKVMAQWSIQTLIYPFYWLLHPQKWLGPTLGSGTSSTLPALPEPSQGDAVDQPDAALTVDRPIQSVLTTVQPWLVEPDTSPPLPRPSVPLTGSFTDRLRESLGSSADTPAIALVPAPVSLPSSASPSPPLLSRWGQQIKTLFHPEDNTVVIRGIASRLGDRQLVLTTADNLSLDVFTTDQQQTLQTLIRQELAQWRYHRRRHWALTQRQWRGIPLVNPQTETVLMPVDWLWRGLYRWQTRAESPDQLLPPTLPPLAQLPAWVEQTGSALTHHPLVETTVIKSQQLSYQLVEALPLEALPPPLRHLGEDLQQKLAQRLAASDHLPETSPDPFALKVLLQAAIAHFFGPNDRRSIPTATADQQALSGTTNEPSPWLQWDELFAELPKPSLAQPLLGRSRPSDSQGAMVPADAATMTVSASVPTVPAANRPQATAMSADPWDENWLEDSIPLTPSRPPLPSTSNLTTSGRSPTLETAFDWIETQAKPVGYDKHILVWCLEWLDRLAYWLETAIGRLWQWLRQRLGYPQNSSLSKSE